MAAQSDRRRKPWGSLIVAILCIAIAAATLILIPGSPLNFVHASQVATPGSITLPPTAVPPTATPAR